MQVVVACLLPRRLPEYMSLSPRQLGLVRRAITLLTILRRAHETACHLGSSTWNDKRGWIYVEARYVIERRRDLTEMLNLLKLQSAQLLESASP